MISLIKNSIAELEASEGVQQMNFLKPIKFKIREDKPRQEELPFAVSWA